MLRILRCCGAAAGGRGAGTPSTARHPVTAAKAPERTSPDGRAPGRSRTS
jgi:hypothetical protein